MRNHIRFLISYVSLKDCFFMRSMFNSSLDRWSLFLRANTMHIIYLVQLFLCEIRSLSDPSPIKIDSNNFYSNKTLKLSPGKVDFF